MDADTITFKDGIRELAVTYPDVAPWLSWWVRDEVASMLFTSQRRMEPAIWDSIPDTTNAEEAMHWKLYASIGRDHSLMEGIRSILRFAEHIAKLIEAAESMFIRATIQGNG